MFLIASDQLLFAQQNKGTESETFYTDSALILQTAIIEAYYHIDGPGEIPGNIALINNKILQTGDGIQLQRILNNVPGVYMQNGTLSTNRIVIRGMGSRTPYNSNRIKAYLNEIPLTQADGVSTPEELDIQTIGKVEIIKGPSSALYGSGLGGSLNFFTPSDGTPRKEVFMQYGSFNTFKILSSASFTAKNSSFYTGAGFTKSDGYRENNLYQKFSVIISGKWNRKKIKISPILAVIGTNAGIPSSLNKNMYDNNPEMAAPAWKAVEGYEKNTKIIGGISIENKINMTMNNHLTIFAKYNNGFEKRPFNNLDDQTTEIGFRNRFSIKTDKTEWIAGTEFFAENYQWQLDLNDSTINRNKEIRRQLNIFGIVNLNPAAKLKISIASALNYIEYSLTDLYSENGDQNGKYHFPVIFSPRIGLNLKTGKKSGVYTSAGHGFSLPSPEETLLPDGQINPDLKPETGWQFETGYRISVFNQTTKIEAALYWIELKNLLVTKRISEDIFTGINAGQTRHKGFELQVFSEVFNSIAFPGKIELNMTYTFSTNQFINFTDDGINYDGNVLPGIPNQVYTAQLIWRPYKSIQFYYNFQYFGFQYLNDDNTEFVPGYTLSNLKAEYRFVLKGETALNLNFGINNITNTHYASMIVVNAPSLNGVAPRYYYPGLPLNFYSGISLKF
ncbi:MAG: TonB-dependent receptor [Bacteroidales bacterium]